MATTNLKPISLKEQLMIQLDILKSIRDFCDSHGLRYYLADGTLIGAIRHNGYIPWDDDIDIEMPRPDYNQLIELFQEQGHLQLVAPGDKLSRYHHIKIYDARTLKIENGVAYKDDYLGVDIDIFALDGSSPDNTEYEEMRDRIYKLYNWYTIIRCGMTGSLRHKIRVATYKMQHWNANNLIKEAVQLCEKYDYNTSKYATRYERYSKGFRVDKECYESTIMKDFEGELFAIPIGYDKVLRAQFGDYMQLPPEEKRVTHHNNNVFWK